MTKKTRKKSLPLKEGLLKLNGEMNKSEEGTNMLKIPGFRKIETSEERDARAKAQEEAANALRAYAEKVREAMDSYVKQAFACLNGDEFHRAASARELKEIITEIQTHTELNPSDTARETAIRAFSEALTKHCPNAKWAVTAMIHGFQTETLGSPGLVSLGVIQEIITEEEMPRDAFRLFGKTYEVNKNLAPSALRQLLVEKAHASGKAGYENYQESVKNLLDQTTPDYSFEKLMAGESGTLGFIVRDEKHGDRFFAGGALLVRSDGEEIQILDAVGRFQRKMLEIQEANRGLKLYSLKSENFRGSGLPDSVFTDLRILHSVLTRGMREANEREERAQEKACFREECKAEREILRKKATVASDRWLLDKEVGIACVSLKMWVNRIGNSEPEKHFFVSFLVERNEEEKVRLVETPERLAELFSAPELLEFTEPEDRFFKLAQPLGGMLRAAYSYAAKKSEEHLEARLEEKDAEEE